MGLLDMRKRVDLGEGQWVEVRPLSIGALRAIRRRATTVEVPDGEERDEALGFEFTRLALQECIVAWSDDAPVTPENIDRLPHDLTFKITAALGLSESESQGADDTPLPTG